MSRRRAQGLMLFAMCAASACTKQAGNSLTPLAARQLPPPAPLVSLNMTGYTAPSGRKFSQLFVANFSVKNSMGSLSPVSARDGLPDALKQAHISDYGFGISGPYSALPYFSDLMLYLSGIVAAQQTLLYCPTSQQGNSSSDAITYTDTRTSPPSTVFLGMRDCEKSYLGLNPASFDYDGDGVPDYLELRCGMNPKNANDALLNPAGDGVSNLEKCKRNIPVDENANSAANQLYAYQYQSALQADGSLTLSVANIPIINGGQDNFLALYLTETNTSTQQSYLYTAYAILGAGVAGQTLNFAFWATEPAKYFSQEIVFQ